MGNDSAQPAADDTFGSNPEFFDYYARESLSAETFHRFTVVKEKIEGLIEPSLKGRASVIDIGCGAGTQAQLWARDGYRVSALDINAPLVELGRQRAADSGLDITFEIGSADRLPWPDESFDICLVPELLEHVPNWQACLDEFQRVVRPGGVLYLSTTNFLCPRQEEYTLPLYSWYPPALKRRYERLAVTTRPEIVNHAKYPAVNWFSPYTLSRALKQRDFRALDRFDLLDTSGQSPAVRSATAIVRRFAPAKALAHCFSPYSVVFGIKQTAAR